MKIIKPERLRQGDVIGICAPCYAIDQATVEPCVEHLRAMGYKVKLSAHIYSTANGFSGSVTERSDDLNALIRDPDVRMILFGGGEVGHEILPYIDYDALRTRPKLIGSFSDGTSIVEAIHVKTGLVTFYGPTPRVFAEERAYNLRCFLKRMTTLDTDYERFDDWTVLRGGRCEGVLTGGYLVNYAAMLQGDYFTWDRNEKYLLFLEDHEWFSKPAVVSNWLGYISQSGLMDNVTGLLFGLYSDENQAAIDDTLKRFGDQHNIPVAHCRDFGHGAASAIFPIGTRAKMDATGKTFEFLESGVL